MFLSAGPLNMEHAPLEADQGKSMRSARGLGSYSPQSLGGKITGPSADEGAMEGGPKTTQP